MPITVIPTTSYNISLLMPKDCLLMLDYINLNKDYLAPWEPIRNESYYSEHEVELRIKSGMLNFKQQSDLNFAILDKDNTRVLGICNFTNIRRGSVQACQLGYSVSQDCVGQGIMHEALSEAIKFVFNQLHLHRIMANYLPHNKRSENVLKKLGFEREGYAKSYLEINGQWEDHVLTALVNPNH